MRNIDLMARIGDILRSAGLRVVAPDPDEPVTGRNREALSQAKRIASRRHMDKIRSSETAAVLVVNVGRPEMPHYVGPNSFAEIGVAFSNDRRVFLLYGMPECYAEELDAWGVTCLNGEIRPLLEALDVPGEVNPQNWTETVQRASA